VIVVSIRPIQLCLGLAVAACGILLSGCDRPVAPSTETPAESSAAIKRMGLGLTPQRGPAEVMPPGAVAVEFEPQKMNFGVLPPGAAVQGTSRLWNVGTTPLTITKSITSCGCTSTENLAGRVIPPGGYTEFTTEMHMKSGLGPKMQKITVFFGPKQVAIQFYTAEVSLPVRLTPPYLDASKRVNNRWVQTQTGEITVSAQDGRPFRIIGAQGRPPVFVDFDPATDQPRTQYTLRWDLAPFQGVIPWYWVVETNRADCPVIDARIRHSSTLPDQPQGRRWVPSDTRLLVGIARPGESFEVSSAIEYGSAFVPDPSSAVVSSESAQLEAELIEAQVDGQYLRYRIRLTVAEHATPGLLYGQLAVGASGFSVPLYIIGRIEP